MSIVLDTVAAPFKDRISRPRFYQLSKKRSLRCIVIVCAKVSGTSVVVVNFFAVARSDFLAESDNQKPEDK